MPRLDSTSLVCLLRRSLDRSIRFSRSRALPRRAAVSRRRALLREELIYAPRRAVSSALPAFTVPTYLTRQPVFRLPPAGARLPFPGQRLTGSVN